MARKTVVIPEKKQKIENIKRKYKQPDMSDKTAQKIQRLEITNGALKTAVAVSGIITVIDLIVPDPAPLVDEAVLVGCTTLLQLSSSIVDKKIDSLVNNEPTAVSINDMNNLTTQAVRLAHAVNDAKQNKVR